MTDATIEPPEKAKLPTALGDDIYIPGVDAEPEESEDSISERERQISDWIRRRERDDDAISEVLGRPVNTVPPYGKPGHCHNELHVPVDSSEDIPRRLWDSAKVIDRCKEIKLVVFHIAGSVGYLEWMVHFLPWREAFHSQNLRIAVRIASSWSPRPGLGNGKAAQNWTGALPIGPGPNGSPIDIRARFRAAFRHRVWLLEELGVLAADYNHIAQHSHQPPIVKARQDISFGNIAGENITSWRARVYLPRGGFFVPRFQEDVRLGFPLTSINFRNRDSNIWNNRLDSTGTDPWPASWSPVDHESFLQDPYRYLDKAAFPLSR